MIVFCNPNETISINPIVTLTRKEEDRSSGEKAIANCSTMVAAFGVRYVALHIQDECFL